MTSPDDAAPPTGSERESRPSRAGGRAFVILPAATFLVGLLLGVGVTRLAVDDGGNGDADGPGSGAASPAASPTPSLSADAIVVPGACTRAARGAGETVTLLREALGAITDLDAPRLADVLDEAEKLDEQIRDDVATCREQASVSPAPATSPAASPAASPAE